VAKRKKKQTLVIVQLSTGTRETKHRAKDLKTALAIGVRDRLPPSCKVRWSRMQKLASVAGGEGEISCSGNRLDGERIRFLAIRSRGPQLKSGQRKRKKK